MCVCKTGVCGVTVCESGVTVCESVCVCECVSKFSRRQLLGAVFSPCVSWELSSGY